MRDPPDLTIVGIFGSERIILADPKAITAMLLHQPYDFAKSKGARSLLKTILGEGLLLAEGGKHSDPLFVCALNSEDYRRASQAEKDTSSGL